MSNQDTGKCLISGRGPSPNSPAALSHLVGGWDILNFSFAEAGEPQGAINIAEQMKVLDMFALLPSFGCIVCRLGCQDDLIWECICIDKNYEGWKAAEVMLAFYYIDSLIHVSAYVRLCSRESQI